MPRLFWLWVQGSNLPLYWLTASRLHHVCLPTILVDSRRVELLISHCKCDVFPLALTAQKFMVCYTRRSTPDHSSIDGAVFEFMGERTTSLFIKAVLTLPPSLGATSRHRTRDRWFTKPLLYLLSYCGEFVTVHAAQACVH